MITAKPTVEEMHKAFTDSYKFLKTKFADAENIDWMNLPKECAEVCKQNDHSSLIMILMGGCYEYLTKLNEGKISK